MYSQAYDDSGTRRYLATVVLFVFAMAVKFFMVDRPAWDADLWRYAISTLIVIPIVWYAGYFFRQAEDERNSRRRGQKDKAPTS